MEFIIPIILMLLSFFLQKKNGASNGKAALTAAAVGAVSYGGIKAWQHYQSRFTDARGVNTEPSAENAAVPATVGASQGALAAVGAGAVDVLKQWGPGGTLAVAGGLTFGGRILKFTREHPFLVGGLAAFIVWRVTDRG